jgi:hypothetical protein
MTDTPTTMVSAPPTPPVRRLSRRHADPLGMFKRKRRRKPGRPKGTGYARVDARVHELMRELLMAGKAPSPTKAAEALVHLAYGWGAPHNRVRRLVRSYPYR